MSGEQSLILMLSDLSNEAQTKRWHRECGGKRKNKGIKETHQEPELTGLRIGKNICRSVRAWFVCVLERERETIIKVYKLGQALDLQCLWPEM